ncbi:MAG: hypothetical protein AAGD05_08900 [Bacteroidota bacterium]
MKNWPLLSYTTLIFLTLSVLTWSCSSDKLPEPEVGGCDPALAYNGAIKAIIDNSCAFSGCHVAGGDGPGDYTTYAGLLGNLENESIKTRVIDQRDMPIAPGEISPEDLELVRCWLLAGFPEN